MYFPSHTCHFRIDMAVSEDKIRPASLSTVKKHGAQPRVLRMPPQAGVIRDTEKTPSPSLRYRVGVSL